MISLLKGEYLCKESIVMAFITVSSVVALVSCPKETTKKPVLLKMWVVPPPPCGSWELHIKAYTEMLRPEGLTYVKLLFTSTS